MIEIFSGLLSSVKKTSPVIFLGLALSSGTVLYGNSDLVGTLGLTDIKENYKPYFGGCFLLSISILFAQIVKTILDFIKIEIRKWRKSNNRKKLLESRKNDLINLTPDEKDYLAPYIFQQKTTRYFKLEDGVKGSLEAKKILYRASEMGNIRQGWAYNMQPWAREHLQENPELLKN